MNKVTRYVVSSVQAKTGLSSSVLIGYAAQCAFALLTGALGLATIFFVFSDWLGYGPTLTSAGMFLACCMLLVASIAWTKGAKSRTVEKAQRELSGPPVLPFLSPPLLNAGIQIGRRMGWRRFLPTVLLVILVGGAATEWTRRRNNRDSGKQSG
ncbi:MAG TPA: hypothetical protein VKW08_11270 [Xanthobacteraceae bacterium]|jgi:hypothetical protein|nr:hypothetical protein [Xanthobacteraceae bacterium]